MKRQQRRRNDELFTFLNSAGRVPRVLSCICAIRRVMENAGSSGSWATWWGETLSSPVCRRKEARASEHLRVQHRHGKDARKARLAALEMGLERVSPHHVASRTQGGFQDKT